MLESPACFLGKLTSALGELYYKRLDDKGIGIHYPSFTFCFK
jgi:hypothetical protein